MDPAEQPEEVAVAAGEPAEDSPSQSAGAPAAGVAAGQLVLDLGARLADQRLLGRHGDAWGQALGARQVGAATAAGDELAGGAGVAGVVVDVAGDDQAHLSPAGRDDLPDEEVDRVVGGRVGLGLDPAGCGHHQNHPVAGFELLRGLAEVDQLRIVEVRPERFVDREQPPRLGQREGEVGAGLLGPPPSDLVSSGTDEEPEEGGETVVPVVVAGQGVEGRPGSVGGRRREGRGVRALAPVLVLSHARRRVDLVAAHDQDLAPGQPVAVDGECRLAEQVRHRVGGVEAVAEVGDVVEPELAFGALMAVDLAGQRALKLPFIQVCAEDQRE